MYRALASVFLLQLGCGPGTDDPSPPTTGSQGAQAGPTLSSGSQTLEHDGMERGYILHIPDDLSDNAALVVVMHGYSGSAKEIRDYSRMDAVADANGFVVAYPKGTQDFYGYNYFNVGYDFHDDTVDDVGFLAAMVDVVVADLQLNPAAVFATGMSNGGDMSYRLACEADWVRAIAPVAGTMMSWFTPSCSPHLPMPVFEIHGTEDDVTWWDGDADDVGGWGPYLGIDAIVDFWVAENGLQLQESTELDNTVATDFSVVEFDRYGGGDSDAELWLYRVVGGGHDWPGAWGNEDIDSSEEVWRFFSQYD
jgi:polyhydroxybutyrate depolymerase